MEKLSRLKETLFSESLDIHHRLLNLTLCATLFGGLFSVFITSAADINDCLLIILAMVIVVLFLLWANIGKRPDVASFVIVFLVNVFVFPIMYFAEGGMHGGMPIWILVGLVFDWLLFRGLVCYIMYGLNIVIFAACVITEMYYPQYVTEIANKSSIGLDIYQSVVAATCIFGIIFKYQASVYEKQNNDLYEKELELLKANEELKKLNQAKSDFLANMSHEIRTPINAVLGMDEIILRESTDENITKYAANIESAGQNLLSLINDILDFSKIESGKMEIVPVTYELFSLMYDCYTMISLSAKEKNIEISIANDPNIPSKLYGDEVRIRQIISNLLSNAVKYTQKGSIRVIFNWVNEDLCISVKDTGIGIEKENLKKLFNTFERVDEKKNRNIEGSGLGLAITKSFVELMGGKISVESEYGKGSIFRVQISQQPMSDIPMGRFSDNINSYTASNKKYRESFQAPTSKILIVDDVKMNLDVMVGLLKPTKIQIDTALSGKICLEMVKEKKYDIIFMDHMMPELDGVETFHLIRKDKTHSNQETPIIALTANAIMGVEEEYKAEGFQDYLSKPVRGNEVENMLLKYLPEEKVQLHKSAEGASGVETAQRESVINSNEYVNNINPVVESLGISDNIVDKQSNESSDEIRQFENPENLQNFTDSENIEGNQSEADSPENIIAKLTFLNTDAGLMYCADSPEMYIDILGSYLNSGHYDALCDNFEKEDWENYRIHMHAVKSTSLTIGAVDISEEAKSIEQNAKDQNWNAIKDNHTGFMERYKKIQEDIRMYVPVTTE